MDGLAEDTKLINDLCAWAGLKPSRAAADLGFAATTLTRPANGKATTRLGRKVLDALRDAYPAFPGWVSVEAVRSNARVVDLEGASLQEPRSNLPIYGTTLAAARKIEGEAIELTNLNAAEVVEYAKRPPLLNRRPKAYGLYVQGSSMHPALPDGEMVAVVPEMALSVGDIVVVYLRPENPDQDDGHTARAVLVKELVRRSASEVILRQYQPAADFTIDADEIVRIDRVLSRREMLS